jgi:hypothetical protein
LPLRISSANPLAKAGDDEHTRRNRHQRITSSRGDHRVKLLTIVPLILALLPFTVVQPDQYQSFVVNWSPANKPFCVAIRSEREWSRVFHPAPVMGSHPPFAPPSAFWTQHALLVVARVINTADASQVFHIDSVTRDERVVEIRYTFRPTPPAPSTMKWWIGAAVAKPLPPMVRFRENGRMVCSVRWARSLLRLS